MLLASELLSRGSYDHDGVGSLILVDIGGATTDIHSALPELEKLTIEERGLVINNEKQFSYRTVDGNLGLRVSATRAFPRRWGQTPSSAPWTEHSASHPTRC